MKKTIIVPSDALNEKIIAQSETADGYAKKLNKLPQKRSRKVLWLAPTVAACVMVAVALGIFLRAPKTPWYNELVVGDEPFENYVPKNYGDILSSGGNRFYPDFDDVDNYFENADLVIIGYPENTFTDEPKAPYSREGKFAGEGEEWYTLDTIRKIKVLDVLKGDVNLESINLHVKEAAMPQEDGTLKIEDTSEFHFIQKQNVKYMFILSKSAEYNGEPTYYATFDCVINVDGLHKSSLKEVTTSFLQGILEKYGEYFKKYDRTSELQNTPDDTEYLAMSGMRYFKNERDAYEYSDLIVVCSPKNDFKDDVRVTKDGKILKTDKEVQKYPRKEVFTLCDMKVLEVIKGDKTLTDIYIPNGCHYYFDIHTNAVELWSTTYAAYENPIVKKDSVYIYYLKRDEALGQNVYNVSGRQCILNIDGTHTLGGLYDYTSKRIYDLYMRHFDIIKKY